MNAIRDPTNRPAYNAMNIGGRDRPSSHHHTRSLSSPRVIFPSLHGISSPSYHTQPNPLHHERHRSEQLPEKNNIESRDWGKTVDISPTDVDASFRPVVQRANSLDGILIPLPKLSLNDDKANEEFAAPKILNKRATTTKNGTNIQTAFPSKWDPRQHISSGSSYTDNNAPSRTSTSNIFGEAMKRRAYYYPASIPTPINSRKTPTPDKPKAPTSILRRRSGTLSTSSRQQECSSSRSLVATSSSSTPLCSPEPAQSICSQSLSPTVPTLASPNAIKSLHSRDHHPGGMPFGNPNKDGSEQEGIGESEYGLQRIKDFPKMLPRSNRCKIKKSQSDSFVSNNEEDHSRPRRNSIPEEKSSVSRHASVEGFAQNKRRTMFDPHVTVFEFPVTDYEKKGGEKWFSEDELAEFKQEAIQRIRMRSTNVIPTGTGRSITVSSKRTREANEMARPQAKPTGSIFFNHPALGCEDEDNDSEIKSSRSRELAIMSHLSQEIRNILVVDPHDIFCALFNKSLNHMIPHASVATARSAKEALSRIEAARKAFPITDGGSTMGFDIIIIEERLRSIPVQQLSSGRNTSLIQHSISTQTAGDDSVQQHASGSSLIRHLVETDSQCSRASLIVGVSAHREDLEKMKRAGADEVWCKPPPEMNAGLRNKLLKLLMTKRNLSIELFD